MNIEQFISLLSQSLSDYGLSFEQLDEQCRIIKKNLTEMSEADAQKFMTDANLKKIVKRIIEKKSKEKIGQTTAEENKQPQQNNNSPALQEAGNQMPEGSFMFNDSESLKNKHSKLTFAAICVLLLPTVLLLASTLFGACAVIIAALTAIIVITVVAVLAVVAGGSLVSIVAILYGATQIISVPRYIGLHEIGIGLIVAGATILLSILLYNASIRLIPFIIIKIMKFVRFVVVKCKNLSKIFLKGCETL